MTQNMKTARIARFALLGGAFLGLWFDDSPSAWEGGFEIALNAMIICVLHRGASDIRRFSPAAPKARACCGATRGPDKTAAGSVPAATSI